MRAAILCAVVLLAACSDTTAGASVRCFDGGVQIYTGRASGDGVRMSRGVLRLTDAQTGERIRVTLPARCVIVGGIAED